jgi:AcrR family transcriptional regulator
MDHAPVSASRTARERARAELTAEIKERAKVQLAEGGGGALSVRRIAREMGMASSALFRYFPSRDALLTALIVDSYDALADAVEAAEHAVHRAPVLDRWVAICHAVRDWARKHPHEYALIFGSPIPGYAAPPDTVAPASRVPVLLVGLLSDLVAAGAYDPAALAPPPADLVAAVAPVLGTLGGQSAPRVGDHPVDGSDGGRGEGGAAEGAAPVPPDLMVRGLMAWTYLFGAVSFELFGHRHGVVEDHRTFFDHEVHRIAAALGIDGSPVR